jgi:hypothetical protein
MAEKQQYVSKQLEAWAHTALMMLDNFNWRLRVKHLCDLKTVTFVESEI